jgi:uncharacterized membrane protein
MLIAALALIGFFVALYLLLWKIGVLGSIACGSGGCEVVQLSEYAEVFGVPVALFGVVGYLAMLAVSVLGLQPRWVNSKRPSVVLLALSGVGVAYSAYLTYLEAAVIHAWCRWCVVSAVIVTAIAVTAGLGVTRWRHAPSY